MSWGEEVADPLASRLAAVRVRPAHRDHTRNEPRPEEWLLVEWPEGEPTPTKFWFSTVPADIYTSIISRLRMIHIRETRGIPKRESNSMTPGII